MLFRSMKSAEKGDGKRGRKQSRMQQQVCVGFYSLAIDITYEIMVHLVFVENNTQERRIRQGTATGTKNIQLEGKQFCVLCPVYLKSTSRSRSHFASGPDRVTH